MTSDSEGDVYCDSLEQMEPEQVTEGWEADPSVLSAPPALCITAALPQHRSTATTPQHCHSTVALPSRAPSRTPKTYRATQLHLLCFVSPQNLVSITWGASGAPQHHPQPHIAVVRLCGALVGAGTGASSPPRAVAPLTALPWCSQAGTGTV